MADTAALKFRLKMVEMVEAERKKVATAKPLAT